MSVPKPPPKSLGPVGRGLWRKVAGDVQPGWALDERDYALMLGACEAADRVAQLDALVASEGLMVKGSRGQMILNPAIGEARLQRQQSTALLAKVELSAPAPRTGHLSGRQRAALRSAREHDGST